jgi:hypothetical protein
MIVESSFGGMIHFSRLIEAMQKSIRLVKGFFPGFTFIILKMEGIRLKVEENSSIEDLREQLKERADLLTAGSSKVLKEHYRDEGILD